MLLSENFVEIIIQAKENFSKVAGQLFTYSATKYKFEILKKEGSTNEYQRRWLFLLVVAVNLILRILYYKLVHENDKNSYTSGNLNLCIFQLVLVVATTEHFRLRGCFPDAYLSSLNSVISIERNFNDGKLQKYNFQNTHLNLFWFQKFPFSLKT